MILKMRPYRTESMPTVHQIINVMKILKLDEHRSLQFPSDLMYTLKRRVGQGAVQQTNCFGELKEGL